MSKMGKRYESDFKDWVVLQMMPPLNRSVAELAVALNLTPQSLRNWRQMARDKGLIVPGNGKTSDQWSSADKFNAVMETAPLSEVEISQYCRIKGIYPEQNANPVVDLNSRTSKTAEERRIKVLERQLIQSDAGRAEAVALLELRKKANAIWGKDKED